MLSECVSVSECLCVSIECLEVYVYSLAYFTVCEVNKYLSIFDIMWFSNENDIWGRRDRTKG